MRLNHLVLSATLLSIAATARAEDPKKDSAATLFVKIGNLTFYRSTEDAFARARKEGKLVFAYRMLGELDGLT